MSEHSTEGEAELTVLRPGWLQRLKAKLFPVADTDYNYAPTFASYTGPAAPSGKIADAREELDHSSRHTLDNEPMSTSSPMSTREPITTASPMSEEENFFAE